MQHLNIPLSRHTKTTRPMRQVVWLMGLALFVSAFVVFRLGTWWLSRGTILSLAPTDTVLAAEFHLNQQTNIFLEEWLSGVPLISDRGLELSDLSPYTHGEFAVFVTKSGERSIAIRTSKDALPTDLLTSYGISMQEQGPFVLLSSTLMPISGTDPIVHRPFFPSLNKVWLGRVVFPDTELGGNFFVSDEEASLELHTPKKSSTESKAIENASIILAGLTWGEDGSPLEGLERLTNNSLFLDEKAQVSVIVRSGEQGLETLVAVRGLKVDSTMIVEELERIGAFARPTLVTQTLPDGSNLEEIMVQPELTSVEEISTSLGTSFRVSTGGGKSILATTFEDFVLFSNQQVLIEDYAKASQDPSSNCSTITTWLDPSFLLLQADLDSMNSSLAVLNGITKIFSGISIEVKRYSTVIHFCRS